MVPCTSSSRSGDFPHARERYSGSGNCALLPRAVLLCSPASPGWARASCSPAPASILNSSLGSLGPSAQAQGLQRPVGFADIVEKVKPAVVSVRVKVDGGPRTTGFEGDLPFPKGSPMDRFFRQFGSPDDGDPGIPAIRAVRALPAAAT